MELNKTFTDFRKHIYASINGTKGNLVKLSKSKILSKREKEKLLKVIEAMESLRVEYYNNRGFKSTQEIEKSILPDVDNIFYYKENEGEAKTFREFGKEKWYYEHELIELLGKVTVEKIKNGYK